MSNTIEILEALVYHENEAANRTVKKALSVGYEEAVRYGLTAKIDRHSSNAIEYKKTIEKLKSGGNGDVI